MPQIASYLQVRANRKQREVPTGLAWRTYFLCAPDGVKEGRWLSLSKAPRHA